MRLLLGYDFHMRISLQNMSVRTFAVRPLLAAFLFAASPCVAANNAPPVPDDIAMDMPATVPHGAGNDNFMETLSGWLKKPPGPQDIPTKLFDDFWLKWELVTTRFKRDGEELRFVYANDLGAKALADGAAKFPNGTVFTKIGAAAVHDPIFDNSLVPGRVQRVQVMWKNPGDPNARDGWVYSLFMPTGRSKGHLSKDEIDACHACHLIAASRDMVFSLPFPVPQGAAPARSFMDGGKSPAPLDVDAFKKKFAPAFVASLPSELHDTIKKYAPDAKEARVRSMPSFDGTLFESREVVTAFARSDKMIYVLRDADGSHALMAIPPAAGDKKGCAHMVTINPPASTPDPMAPPSMTPPAAQFREWDVCLDKKASVSPVK